MLQDVPNNEAIWAEIASEEQREHDVQHLADAWSTQILKAEAEEFPLPEEITDQIDFEDSKYVYSKVNIFSILKYLKEVMSLTLKLKINFLLRY